MAKIRQGPMKYGDKINWARKAQSPRVTQKQAGILVGLDEKAYQSVELSRSVPLAQQAVPILSEKWGIPESWFWSKDETNPYTGEPLSKNDRDSELEADYVDVRLYNSDRSGRILRPAMKESKVLSVEKSLGDSGSFAVRVMDDDNAPRIKSGQVVIVEPQDIPEDGKLYLVAHKQRFETIDGERVAFEYLRTYTYGLSSFEFQPLRAGAEVFNADEVEVIGLVKALRTIHAPGWTTTERCDTGLPSRVTT